MDWSKLTKFVSKAAPILGTAIGGPIGGLAGGAISLITSAFGIEATDDPEAIYEAIKADPQAVVKLKQIELENKTQLQKIALQRDEAHLKDVQNARSREIEMVKVTGKKDWSLHVLAWLIVSGFFISFILLTFTTIPTGSKDMVMLFCGALIAGFSEVRQYFFGSSAGSKQKTGIMAMSNRNGN